MMRPLKVMMMPRLHLADFQPSGVRGMMCVGENQVAYLAHQTDDRRYAYPSSDYASSGSNYVSRA